MPPILLTSQHHSLLASYPPSFFSNSLSSTIIEPNLTTVDQPGQRIGKIALTYLIEEIENETNSIINKTVEIKTNLIIRESTIKI